MPQALVQYGFFSGTVQRCYSKERRPQGRKAFPGRPAMSARTAQYAKPDGGAQDHAPRTAGQACACRPGPPAGACGDAAAPGPAGAAVFMDSLGGLGSEGWIQALLQKFLASRYEDALEREMEAHLQLRSRTGAGQGNRRNGAAWRTLRTSFGRLRIRLPRDRDGTFEPVIAPKWVKDARETEWRLLHMYTSGGELDAVAGTVRAVYRDRVPARRLGALAASFWDGVRGWQNRPLKPLYLYVRLEPVPVQGGAGEKAAGYTAWAFLGCDAFGRGEVLGLWRNDTGSRSTWLQVLGNLKDRGVEDILFFSMDGMPGLVESIASVFPRTLVQPRAESVGQAAD